jgi:hypothetical protein
MDRKPILDLLAEFKAEIINEVEEEIEDEVWISFRGCFYKGIVSLESCANSASIGV